MAYTTPGPVDLRSSRQHGIVAASIRPPDGPVPPSLPTTSSVRTFERTADTIREVETATNNSGTGADVIGSNQPEQRVLEGRIQDVIERSNRLAEQASQLIERSNQLAERSNQIAERANQLVEQSNRPAEHSDAIAQRFNQLFERLNQHFERSDQHHERSNFLAEELIKPVDKIGGALRNINRILMRIQHAIVRNQKDNGISALDCLANEKGETPGMSDAMSHITSSWQSEYHAGKGDHRLPIVINGVSRDAYLSDGFIGPFLHFYGIGDDLFKDKGTLVKDGKQSQARIRLREYLSSCIG
ncbi:hypothetical protein FRC11_005800 [Ceratobasidium sp. 423]|nr:hypothetical protein FRC11_005800 [Ceratobasidium sp. 423]